MGAFLGQPSSLEQRGRLWLCGPAGGRGKHSGGLGVPGSSTHDHWLCKTPHLEEDTGSRRGRHCGWRCPLLSPSSLGGPLGPWEAASVSQKGLESCSSRDNESTVDCLGPWLMFGKKKKGGKFHLCGWRLGLRQVNNLWRPCFWGGEDRETKRPTKVPAWGRLCTWVQRNFPVQAREIICFFLVPPPLSLNLHSTFKVLQFFPTPSETPNSPDVSPMLWRETEAL